MRPTPGWEGLGAAYEYAFQLCNEARKDCWINVPIEATDDFVTQLATLAQAMLSPDLHLYVEFSNEVWNSGFPQWSYAQAQGNIEADAGGSAINLSGDTNHWDWGSMWYAERAAQVSVIFRNVFGDAAMMTQVRPVLESQEGNADGVILPGMMILMNYFDNPAVVSTPHPPNYYFWGGGGAVYQNDQDAGMQTTPAEVDAWLAGNPGLVQSIQSFTQWTHPFGLKNTAYEGGPSFDTTGDATIDNLLQSACYNSGIQGVMATNQQLWEQNGGDLVNYFQLAGDYVWGFVDDVFDLNTAPSNYKWLEMQTLASQPPAAPTFGNPIPASIQASTYEVPPSWAIVGGPQSFQAPTWFGYTLLPSAAGSFKIALNAGCADAKGEVEVWVDGNVVATLAIPDTGSVSTFAETTTVSVTLDHSVHGLLLRGAKGTSAVGVNTIDVTP